MENESFIMLPNKLVWNYENKEDTYLNTYGEKIVHILPYLDGMTNRFGKTIFTLEDMIVSCGLLVDMHKNKSVSQFKRILLDLKTKGIIYTEDELDQIKPKDFIKCEFNMPFEQDEDNNNTKFFTITHSNYLKIMDAYEGKLSKNTLLKVYFYIKSRIYRRKENSKRGKAECFFDTYENITKDLKISQDTWSNYIKELKKIGLLYYGSIGNVEKDGEKPRPASNVYSISNKELIEGLKESKHYYTIENNYTITNRKVTEETSRINGYKGKIASEKAIGKDATKFENILATLEEESNKIIDDLLEETKNNMEYKETKLKAIGLQNFKVISMKKIANF